MIVLDTNVISEALRPAPADPVRRWMEKQPTGALFTTSVCEAELKLGAAILPQGRRRSELENAIAIIFQQAFAVRVLPFDRAAASAYALIGAARRRVGRPIATLDAQIAAIARAHGATVATRNVVDFIDCGLDLVDPWQA
jgi:predicted nucleic acid-binding protein